MTNERDASREARELWDKHPAGASLVAGERGTSHFFEEMRRTRYETNPWLMELLPRLSGDTILEIGCGAGTDLAVLGGAFGHAVGIDLAQGGAALARGALAHWGVPGWTLVADAQSLPLGDAFFDFTYSCGVIHHIDRPDAVIRETYRILKPGGKVVVAVYHRWSLFALYKFVRFIRDGAVLRMSWSRWLSMIEQGAEQEGLAPKVALYSRREARRAFRNFRELRMMSAHLGVDIRLPRFAEPVLSRWLGWYLIVEATK